MCMSLLYVSSISVCMHVYAGMCLHTCLCITHTSLFAYVHFVRVEYTNLYLWKHTYLCVRVWCMYVCRVYAIYTYVWGFSMSLIIIYPFALCRWGRMWCIQNMLEQKSNSMGSTISCWRKMTLSGFWTQMIFKTFNPSMTECSLRFAFPWHLFYI